MDYKASDVTDAATRLRILVEGVKMGYIRDFNTVTLKSGQMITDELNKLRVEKLGELSKKDLNKLIGTIQARQAVLYDAGISSLGRGLQGFFKDDMRMVSRVMATIATKADKPLSRAAAMRVLAAQSKRMNPLFGRAAATDSDRLFRQIMLRPTAANGRNVGQMIDGIRANATNSVENTITSAWAKNASVHETKTALVGMGDRATMAVSQTRKLVNQAATVIDTAMSHVHNMISAQVESTLAERYIWLSVMDSRTSDECMELEGQIFEYGKGPLPPLHYNCRSQTQALLTEDTPKKETYLQWLKRQPEKVQTRMIGAKDAKRLRAGKLQARKFAPNQAITYDKINIEQIFQQ